MKNKKKRISYIRKPMPKQSFFCLGFAAVGLVCFGFSLGNSIVNQGNGGPDVAAWALTSPAFFCGGRDLRCENAENEGSQLHSCACRDDRERDFTVLLAGHAGDRSAECVLKR